MQDPLNFDNESEFCEAITNRVRPILTCIVRRMMPRAKYAAIEDVLADVQSDLIVKIFKRATDDPSPQTPDRFDAYWITAGKRMMIDLVRRRMRLERFIENVRHCERNHSDSPLDILIREEEEQLLHSALERLAELDREMLQRRFIDQQPYAEIASDLGITPVAVRVRVHRALMRLENLLN